MHIEYHTVQRFVVFSIETSVRPTAKKRTISLERREWSDVECSFYRRIWWQLPFPSLMPHSIVDADHRDVVARRMSWKIEYRLEPMIPLIVSLP